MIADTDNVHAEPHTVLVQLAFYLFKGHWADTPDFHEVRLVKMNQVPDIQYPVGFKMASDGRRNSQAEYRFREVMHLFSRQVVQGYLKPLPDSFEGVDVFTHIPDGLFVA